MLQYMRTRPYPIAMGIILSVALMSWCGPPTEGGTLDKPQPVRVEVKFGPGLPKFSNVNVIARLENVSQEDGGQGSKCPKATKTGVSTGGKGNHKSVPLILKDVPIAADAKYNIRVFIDVDRDGKLSKGDFFTTARFSFDGNSPPVNKKGEIEIPVDLNPEILTNYPGEPQEI